MTKQKQFESGKYYAGVSRTTNTLIFKCSAVSENLVSFEDKKHQKILGRKFRMGSIEKAFIDYGEHQYDVIASEVDLERSPRFLLFA